VLLVAVLGLFVTVSLSGGSRIAFVEENPKMVPDASVLQVYQDLKKLFSHGDQKGPVDGETWYLPGPHFSVFRDPSRHPTDLFFRYLISSIWFRQLRIFLGIGDQASSDLTFEATAHPGPIDNTHLYDPDTKSFKECLVEEIDYVVVTADEWKALYETFKMTEGQQPESRKVSGRRRRPSEVPRSSYAILLTHFRPSTKGDLSSTVKLKSICSNFTWPKIRSPRKS
jgi:hypothetical protein